MSCHSNKAFQTCWTENFYTRKPKLQEEEIFSSLLLHFKVTKTFFIGLWENQRQYIVLKVQKEIMKVTHTPHVLKWTKQSQPLQRTAVNSWTFPKSFQLISHREIAELQQIRVVWGVLILWNRFSHVRWISRPDFTSPNQNPGFCSERITFTYQLL